MNQTDLTLLEQMRINEFEVDFRKNLFGFTAADANLLLSCRSLVEPQIDSMVSQFYQLQTEVREIALLIGDAETLSRLQQAMRRYVMELFAGSYGLDYVNNRLRIGLVHKRIGVEPKLYLSAIHTLKTLLHQHLSPLLHEGSHRLAVLAALDKLIAFDNTLVFDTYIRSLVSEIETAKNKSEEYARMLELKVKERTQQLEEMMRVDPLTGLLNVRALHEVAFQALQSAQRRSEPISVVFLDVDDFKQLNDAHSHQYGDNILRVLGQAIKTVARIDDPCFRYGGDEFCVILNNCRADQAQTIFVERLEQELNQRLSGVSISSGIAQTGPEHYLGPDQLIHQADEAMYEAKNRQKLNTNNPEQLAES